MTELLSKGKNVLAVRSVATWPATPYYKQHKDDDYTNLIFREKACIIEHITSKKLNINQS